MIVIHKLPGFSEYYSQKLDDIQSEKTVIIVGPDTKIDNLDVIPDIVASPTTGTDHINFDYCQKHNIKVLTLRGEVDFLKTIYATAEHTINLMLCLMRKMNKATQVQDKSERYRFMGAELHDKYVAIIGYGRIGEQVHKILNAFGCHVTYFDRDHFHIFNPENFDIVTLHTDLNDSSYHLLDEWHFSRMKDTYFINTSRANCINQEHFLQEIDKGKVKGAALDVFHAPIKKRDNLVLTPHIGGCTHESREKADEFIYQQIVRCLDE